MSNHLLRFKANVVGTDDEGGMVVDLQAIVHLNREESLKYAKENGVEIPNLEDFTGIDLTDSYTINTGKKTKEEALEDIKKFIENFTKELNATAVDMKTGKVLGSESNIVIK